MQQREAWINIDECVLSYLSESEQNNNSRYYKCWQLAYRGADELGLDIFYSVKTVKLPVNANQTVTLPSDYLQFTKIGQFDGNGGVALMGRNVNLSNFNGLQANRVSQTSENSLFVNYYDLYNNVFYNYWNEGYSNLYGYAPVINGGFSVDEANGIILINGNSASSIILEYKASPSQEEVCFIPKMFKEALIAYIAWKDIRYLPSSRRGNGGDKEQRRREYFNERRLAKQRYQPFHLEEALNYTH